MKKQQTLVRCPNPGCATSSINQFSGLIKAMLVILLAGVLLAPANVYAGCIPNQCGLCLGEPGYDECESDIDGYFCLRGDMDGCGLCPSNPNYCDDENSCTIDVCDDAGCQHIPYPSTQCQSPDNGSGTAILPASCTSGLQGHMQIIDGLPPTAVIEIDAKLFNPTLPIPRNPGSPLGGDIIIPVEMIAMDLKSAGPVVLNKTVNFQVQEVIFTGPYIPFDPVQSFGTDLFQLQGQLPIGDPDFDLLRITAGTNFGMPSPGHTTLTKLPGGDWAVESFFDITYRIDFVGNPGGPLAGMSGSTTATSRFQTVIVRNPCEDDGDLCTDDVCIEGQCLHLPKYCNDGDPCTSDTCVGGDCVFTPNSPAAQATGTAPTSCGACDGSATVDVTGGTPPYTYLWSTGETTQTIGLSETGTHLCINAGGLEYIASTGDTFIEDYYYNPGLPATTAFSNFTVADIAGTTDDSLYRTERNIVAAGGTMTYNIPVVNGSYDVELHFAELFYGVINLTPPFEGKRKFDVFIEGTQVLNDFDINDTVGPATAIMMTFVTTVADDTLDIAFTSVVNRAKVNGICVKSREAAGLGLLCAGAYSVTVADANGCRAISEVTLPGINCPDDNDLCTTDTCINGVCEHLQADCNDNNACTDDFCSAGIGCHYLPTLCDDNDVCTDNLCNSQTGCYYALIDCSDNDPCTDDACDSGAGNERVIDYCVHTPIDCNDNDPCTEDGCDNGVCTHNEIPGCNDPCVNIICDDGNACTDDICIGGACFFFPPLACEDFNSCTEDECISGQCVNTLMDCNDQDDCTLDECIGGICFNTGIVCDDQNGCTTDDCVNGGCVYTPVVCNDNDACTTDACDNDACVYTRIVCNDQDDCTTDACQNGDCVYSPVVCDDLDPCTTDNCVNGRCMFKPLDCNDDEICTEDFCSNGLCVYNNLCNPCTLEVISFTLVNSVSDLEIAPLENGGVINLFYTPNVNIRANLCVDPVGSVKFNLNGPTFRIENSTPYALAGDAPPGNYHKWNASIGLYELTATPYSLAGATGTMGTGKTITFYVINQQIACLNHSDCDDSNACTDDECQNGQCFNTAIDCDDDNACTTDDCSLGSCVHAAIICDDDNNCTDDDCNSLTGCVFTQIPDCCLSATECNDGDACTTDECIGNVCEHTPVNSGPSHLHVVNTVKSWKKLKLGYSSTSLFTPKQDVIAGGNTMMCVTLRGNAATDWSRIQIRPQGSVSSPASLGSYGLGTSFTEICIPLASFGAGVDFTKLTLIEIPYSNGAHAFEIDIQKIEFRGGATPFLWFGDPKTDNKHDGTSATALSATLIEGSPCGAPKLSQNDASGDNGNIFMNAYPNPFSDEVNIEFTIASKERVRVEIVNLEGRLVSLIFDGEVKASELQSHKFKSEKLANGMYFYRLITESGELKNGKLLLSR